MGRKNGEEHSSRKIFGEITRKRSSSQKFAGYEMNENSGVCIRGISEDWMLDLMGLSQIIKDFGKTNK